jgi:uncharacterized membrane protein AbrB (regulator of aidB expression)
VIVAHIMGIPVEETVLQFAPGGVATITVLAVAGRQLLSRMRRR